MLLFAKHKERLIVIALAVLIMYGPTVAISLFARVGCDEYQTNVEPNCHLYSKFTGEHHGKGPDTN